MCVTGAPAGFKNMDAQPVGSRAVHGHFGP